MADTYFARCLESKIALSIVISLFISISHFTSSVLAHYMHPLQTVLQADGPIFIISMLINFIGKKPLFPPRDELVLSIVYSVSTSAAIICIVVSLAFIPPFDSEAVVCTNLIFTALFSSLFLKEIIDVFDIFALVLSMFGMLMIAQPSFIFNKDVEETDTLNRVIGFAFALVSSLMIASMLICNRKVKNTPPTTLMILTFAILSVVCLTLTVSFGLLKRPDNIQMILYPIIVTVSDLIAQYLLIRIVRIESATTVSIKVLINLPMILLLQLAFLQIVPDGFSFGGSLLILIAVVLIVIKDKLLLHFKLKKNGVFFQRFANEDSSNESSPVLSELGRP